MNNEIKYPLAKETINTEDVDALCDWLKTYPRLTKGELTPQFEQKWADFIGTKYAVFCNSGSSANLLMVYAAMMLNGIKKIVVPPVGWVTTISPAIQFGLQISSIWSGSLITQCTNGMKRKKSLISHITPFQCPRVEVKLSITITN